MRVVSWSACCCLLVLTLGLAGCSESVPATPPVSEASTPDGQDHEMAEAHTPHDGHAEHAQHDAVPDDMAKMRETLAKLSPEDRASAEKQHFCPVSKKMLGTMGAPKKVTVDGRDVWLCCPGCETALRENAAEILAKLDL